MAKTKPIATQHSLAELKEELLALPPEQLIRLCLRLAKHKQESKELLGYLLFHSGDESSFIQEVQAQMEEEFQSLNTSQVYLAKKTLRKVLRTVHKYIRFSGSARVGIELLMTFCIKLKTSGIPQDQGSVIGNMYLQQMKHIQKHIHALHEDLQYDYQKKMEELGLA